MPACGDRPALAAAAWVLADLVGQGWGVRVDGAEPGLDHGPPKVAADPAAEKAGSVGRNCSSAMSSSPSPSVRRFVAEMERPREFDGRFVSIF